MERSRYFIFIVVAAIIISICCFNTTNSDNTSLYNTIYIPPNSLFKLVVSTKMSFNSWCCVFASLMLFSGLEGFGNRFFLENFLPHQHFKPFW